MADRYQIWTNGAIGGLVARGIGLPRPEPLRRYTPGGPLLDGVLSIGGVGHLSVRRLLALLKRVDLRLNVLLGDASSAQPAAYGSDTPEVDALLFDASGIESTADLAALYEFFHPQLRALRPCGRVVIIGSTRYGAAQRAIEGFMWSLGKELRRGATANLVRIDPALQADDLIPILTFLLSARSAYVSGQVLVIGPSDAVAGSGASDGRPAVVIGAARGIGAVITETLAREGLSVTCVDDPGQADTLPALTREVGAASPAHLGAYRELCAFPVSPVLPITYPHLTAFPMAMSLMTRRDFPFPVLGLVHIRNVIEQPRPISAAEPLTFHVSIASPYEHPRGSAFDVTADARNEFNEIVWHSVSTYLHRTGRSSSDRTSDPASLPPTWHLPPDLGRRYASISGDRNPIHLYPWTAKLFGFPRQIAHGMWTMARCLAALDATQSPSPLRASVDFRAPVPLPSDVTFTASPAEDDAAAATDFVLQASSTGRTHLTGRLDR